MTLKNLPTLADIVADPTLAIGLDAEAYMTLLQDCDAQRKIAEQAKKAVVAVIRDAHSDAIKTAYAAKGDDFGSIHITVATSFDLEICTDKKVEWDQAGLAELEAQMRDAGDDPAEYIKVERKVEEKKFTAWPSMLQKAFLPHRTTKPGSVTIALTKIAPAELV